MAASVSGRYRMKAPCESCPFRVSVKPYLTAGRALEIAQSILQGADFPCHKTTREVEDPDYDSGGSDLEDHPGAKVCAGSMGTQENEGRPNQMLRIAGRLGMYEPGRVDTTDLYPSLDAWVKSYAPDADALEHCGIASPDCEDPPGWGMNGSALSNPEPGTCTQHCEHCGEPMCDACTAEPGCCIYC